MHPYTAADTLRIAKRYNNPKRSYLLVNPLQAKHIPVSPAGALSVVVLDAHSVQVIIGPQVQSVKSGIEALI